MLRIKAKTIRRFHSKIKLETDRKPLIETHELNEILKSQEKLKHLKVLDCSWFLPTDSRKAVDLYKLERIPNSQLFNIDEVADKSTDLAHMMPSEEEFKRHMKSMDIRKNDQIVCYDRVGMFSAPRAWFTLKIFGCNDVYVLNGGYPKWIAESFPLERGEEYGYKKVSRVEAKDSDFDFKIDQSKVINLNKVIEASAKIIKQQSHHQIIDCRPPPRYRGEVDEPRPCLRKGHIDGAVNVFFKDLLDENSCFKSNEDILAEFERRYVDVNKSIIFSCGSGCTACVDILAMSLIGKFDNCSLYDGSWAEYGNISEDRIKHELENVKL